MDASELLSLPHAVWHGVFKWLGPKDLCRVGATCKLWCSLGRDGAANRAWKDYYALRWQLPGLVQPQRWQALYGLKLARLRSWGGRYAHKSPLHARCVV